MEMLSLDSLGSLNKYFSCVEFGLSRVDRLLIIRDELQSSMQMSSSKK